jgi:hypothetical protein
LTLQEQEAQVGSIRTCLYDQGEPPALTVPQEGKGTPS